MGILHPQYNDKTLKNDIGLIKLKWGSKIQFSENIYPACLPAVDMCLPEGTDLTVTGFGATKANGNKLANTLQGAELPIFNHDACGAHEITEGQVDVTTADGTSTSADNSLALTYGQTCGRYNGPTSAIVGGTDRNIKNHGYHAALE